MTTDTTSGNPENLPIDLPPSYWGVFVTFARNSLIREMTFRTNFLIQCISSICWTLMNLGFYLVVVFQLVNRIGPGTGWGPYEFLVFLATTMIANSFVQAFFMPNAQEFSELIRTGRLDFALVKPIDTQFLISLEKVDWSALSNFVFGVGLLVVGIWQISSPAAATPPHTHQVLATDGQLLEPNKDWQARLEKREFNIPSQAGEQKEEALVGSTTESHGHTHMIKLDENGQGVTNLVDGHQHDVEIKGGKFQLSQPLTPIVPPPTMPGEQLLNDLGFATPSGDQRAKPLKVTPMIIAFYVFYLLCGVAVLYSLMISLAASSIWLGRNQTLYNFWFYITNFSRYPMEIYNRGWGKLLLGFFTFFVPVLVVVNVPARLLAQPLSPRAWWEWPLAGFAVIATLVSLVLSRWIFKTALRSYRSASS